MHYYIANTVTGLQVDRIERSLRVIFKTEFCQTSLGVLILQPTRSGGNGYVSIDFLGSNEDL